MPIDFDKIAADWPVERVLRERLGIEVRNNAFKCPMHDDANASASLFIKNGHQRWRCHVCDEGGDAIDLVRFTQGIATIPAAIEWLVGSEPPRKADASPKRPPPGSKPALVITDYAAIPHEHLGEAKVGQSTPPLLHAGGFRQGYTPEMVHRYVTTSGVPLGYVLRVLKPSGKFFIPMRWSLKHGWVAIRGKEQLPLYGAFQLAKYPNKPVLVLEGEKCVDLAQPLLPDWVLVSWWGGCNKAKDQDFSPLNGRDVTVWPDADEAGLKAMRAVLKGCEPHEAWWLEPKQEWMDKGNGFDVADLLKTPGFTAAQLRDEIMALRDKPAEPKPKPIALPKELEGVTDIPWVLGWVSDGHGGLVQRIAKRDENNLYLWIERHPSLKGRLTYDVFTKLVLLDRQPVDYETGGWNRLSHAIGQPGVLAGVKADKVSELATRVAMQHPVNPLADELKALVWDKQPRHLTDYAGVEPTPWAHCAGRRWMIGLVRRILSPGWKHDGMLVLEGPQGVGKSRFFEVAGTILGRNLHAEIGRLVMDADCQMKLAGRVVVELSEMLAHRQGDTDALKQMITSTTDIYRRPYARAHETVPRSCVFGGSINQIRWLRDRTGNRRYWVVPVTKPMDLGGLKQDMPMLLAEAIHAIGQGERNWLEGEEIGWQVTAARSRMLEPGWTDKLREVVEALEQAGQKVYATLVWEQMGVTPHQQGQLGQALEEVMEGWGWEKARDRPHSNRRLWRRMGDKPAIDGDIPA